MEIKFPNCENPQRISAPTGGYGGYGEQAPVYRPCGHCWSCMGRKSHIKAGLAIAEAVHPYSPLWAEPGWLQFWTLTDPDSSIPMTQPQAHDLSLNWDQDRPFSGPFVRQAGKSRPVVLDGVAYKTYNGMPTGTPLTPGELELEHVKYLRTFLKWSNDQVQQWRTGNYESMSTLQIKVMQDFVKRLRTWFGRNYPDLPMFRMLYTGEYGDQRNRAHYHIILYGWPPFREAQEYLIYAWKAYHDDAIIDPKPRDAIHFRKSWLKPEKAGAAYVCKDLAKGRNQMRATPALAARQLPFVRTSLKPPLGQAALEIWLDRDIRPVIAKAGSDEVEQCWAARQAYTQHTLHLPPAKREIFTTSDYWRGRVQELFHPDVWTETTWLMNADQADQIQGAEWDGSFEEQFDVHCAATHEKNRTNEERTINRKRRKSALRPVSERF